MALTASQITLIRAYQKYVDAGQRYMAGRTGFRKRVAEAALQAEQDIMQEALRELLSVAVESYDETTGELVLRLPAEGRIGQTRIIDAPRYKIAALPVGSDRKVALLWRGRDNAEFIKDIDACMSRHTIRLNPQMQGEAPLFGNLLPFQLEFTL